MGESVLTTRTVSSSGSSYDYVLMTRVITKSIPFIVPSAKDNKFKVMIYGAGGGGACSISDGTAGGGGGWLNNGELTLTVGDVIPITIGKGGRGAYGTNPIAHVTGNSGESTSFGSYLFANSGGPGISGGTLIGGSGGSGGGQIMRGGFGGNTYGVGYQFGGGGMFHEGGDGGIWGGGGGAGNYGTSYIGGKGGTYGGNGGSANTVAKNGTNTIGYSNTPKYLQGQAIGGGLHGGGGGYGGNGGTGYANYPAGGGGYGGRGGNNGGGGGGYAGSGGQYGGGGGGYGKGGDGKVANSTTSIIIAQDGEYGGGGGGFGTYSSGEKFMIQSHAGNGGDGICIIQYYAPATTGDMNSSDIYL